MPFQGPWKRPVVPSGWAGHFMDQRFLWAEFMPLKESHLESQMILENAFGRQPVLEYRHTGVGSGCPSSTTAHVGVGDAR